MGKLSKKALKIMILMAALCTFCILMLTPFEKAFAGPDRGIKVCVKDISEKELPMYEGSYALLIGVSNYTAGWPDLKSISSELDQVENILKKQGFHVVKIMNPDSKALNVAFEEFIDQYGFDPNNRLLFFFSGHGHTRKGGEKGYLVPVDAPDPRRDERSFLRKALPMTQILSWSRQMEAKHALFLFDSCFSGTVFKVKSLPKRPPHITRSTSLPVRQYITAGDAGDPVPASSVFTPAFIDALKYGWADLNGDNYVSGTELGIYLQEKVPQHTSQTPQYGKIKDYKLSRGDYIFNIKSTSGSCTLQVKSSPPGAKVWIDGRLEGTSPVEVAGLTPGRVMVEAKKDGYGIWKEQVLLREDHPMIMDAVLEKKSSGGILQIQSNIPQASWYLDGIYAGRTPDEMKNVPPGTHRITIKAKGHYKWTEMINMVSGKLLVIHADIDSENLKIDAQHGRLYVDVYPSNAQVKIMNIRPKYSQGMPLSPGSYHLNISAQGYVTQGQWIKLSKGEEKHVNIELAPQKTTKTFSPGPKQQSETATAPNTKPAPAGQVFENVKRALTVWKDSIFSGPSGPPGNNRGDSDINNPSLDGGP